MPTTSGGWRKEGPASDHWADPDARSWEELTRGFGLTDAERAEIDASAQRMIAEARAFRLADVPRRQHTTQVVG